MTLHTLTLPGLDGGAGGGVRGPVGGGVLSAREDEEKVACDKTGRARVGAKVSPGLAMHEARPARTDARAEQSVVRVLMRLIVGD